MNLVLKLSGVSCLRNVRFDKKWALLAGSATQDFFEMLSSTGDGYKTAKDKLDEYFLLKENVDYEVLEGGTPTGWNSFPIRHSVMKVGY